MKAGDRHFINRELLAPNVLEVDVDARAIAPLLALVPLIRTFDENGTAYAPAPGLTMRAACPADWGSDMVWLSQDDIPTYRFFEDIYHRIAPYQHVARHIDHDRSLMLYSTTFVTRSRCAQPYWHHDWSGGTNEAFTMMIPLTANCEDMGLAYANFRGEQCEYRYRTGKGILFGDHFLHATAPGELAERAVFLCFNFGTDRMDNWDKLAETTARQGLFHRRPDGQFIRKGKVLHEEG